MSDFLSSGIRQGGVLSPYLFAVYVVLLQIKCKKNLSVYNTV